MAKKCAHEESRLTCIDCSAPICSNCMVQCPVGFRCSSCGKGPVTAAKKSKVSGGIKLFGLSALIGSGGAWAMLYFSIPYVNCILYFFVGSIAGQWLYKFIDYAWRDRAGRVIVLGTLLGMCFSPLIVFPPILVSMVFTAFTNSPQEIFNSLGAVVSMLFTPCCFIAGILRSTVWGFRY